MPLKNTVAVERRMDLASLFCMISRHGPAVALAVIAMVSVLAGFIIYRTVRGKRRKATAADGGDQRRGEERDAAVIDPCTEEGYGSVESTDVCDEASSDMKEDLIQSDLKIRHRHIAAAAAAAAAEEKPPPYSHLKSDFQVSDTMHTTSDGTGEMAVMWDMFAKEASQDLQSDTNKVGEMVADYQQGATDPGVKDVIEEVHDNNRCSREPEPTNYQHEEKMVLKAEYHGDEDVPKDKEENNFPCALNCSEETSYVGEVGDDRLHNNKTPQEINSVGSTLEEPAIDMKNVPDTSLNCNKEEEEEVQDIVDCHSYSSNNRLFPKEEKQYAGVGAEVGCVDHPDTAHQAEIWSSTLEQETNVPSTQQDQHDHVTVEATAANGNYDGPASEVIEEMLEEDHLHKLIAVKPEDHLPQFDSEEVAFDQKEESDLTPNQEVGVLFDDADQVKEKVPASDNSMACGDEPDSSSVAPPCLSIPIEVDSRDDLSGVITEAKAHISGGTDFSDVSDCQQPQLENEKPLSLAEKTGSVSLCPDMPTNESVNQPENNRKGTMVALAEDHNNPMYDPHIQPRYEDQQSVTAVHDVFDKACIAADPDTVRPACDIATTTLFKSDMSPSQDQQSDQVKNNEILVEIRAKSTTDAPACDNTTTTSPGPAEEISHADMLSLSQDQQRDLMENDEMLVEPIILSGKESTASDNTTIPSPITTEEISLTDMLSPSQDQQNDLMEITKKFAETMILSGTDATDFDKATVTSPIISEEVSHTDDLTAPQSQDSDQMESNEKFAETRSISNTDAPANATTTSPTTADEISHMDLLPLSQYQQSVHLENMELKDETQTNSANDTPACDDVTTYLPTTAEETSPEMMSSSQEQQSEQTKNKEDFSEVTTAVAPTVSLPVCQIPLLFFEQSEIRENDISPVTGADEESGISSMAVSPDLQDAGDEFDVTDEHTVQPVMQYDQESKGKSEAQNSLFADDVTVSSFGKDTHTQTGMVFGLQPIPSQLPDREKTDWKTYEKFVVNDDMFGCEIEDSYHREMSQFVAQIAASVTSFTDEQKTQTDMKAVEVVEMKKTGESAEKKEETKAGQEKEEESERTEISIMEATMDNNEWITESNYQVPPWLNPSASSLAQDNTKINQPPTEECQLVSVVSDTTDIPPPPEVKQTSSPSLTEENLENNKKVVAVQPMPQNVNVTFRVHYFTQSPYQTVAITGDQQELGNWKGFIPLERAKDGHWATVVSLPAESHVEWKFVVVDKGEVCRWEECGNRLLDTGYGEDLLVHKWWGHL